MPATTAIGSRFDAGGDGNDNLQGGAGDDVLFGGDGDDTLAAGTGNNELHPGVGTDTVNGSGGFAVVSYAELASSVTVNLSAGLTGGAAGTDTLINVLGAIGSSAGDILTGGSSTIFINGGGGNDKLFFGSSTSDPFQGDAGYDELHGDAGSRDTFRIQYDEGMDQFFNFDFVGGDRIQIFDSQFNVSGSGFFAFNTTGLATAAADRLKFETDARNSVGRR